MFARLVALCLLSSLLLACTPIEPTPTAATPLALAPVSTARWTATTTTVLATATATATAVPTNTPTVMPPTATATPAETPTYRPTVTPRPTATPTPPYVYPLPAWVNDPAAAVILTALRVELNEGDGALSLLNAETGEQYDLFSTEESVNFGWQPTETTLSLRYSFYGDFYMDVVDIATGQTSQLPRTKAFVPRYDTPDGRYTVEVNGDPGAEVAAIKDKETGQLTTLEDPFNGGYPDRVWPYWSVDGALLLVQRIKVVEAGIDGISESALTIYTADGRLYRYYANVDGWIWAADGSYRLLTYSGDPFENGTPCILDVQINTTTCLEEIVDWRESSGIENTGYYEWLPDGSGLSFIYWDRQPYHTGLCVIDITSRQINCPVNEGHLDPAVIGAEVGGRAWLVGYQWSPDGRYLALEISPYGPESDDGGLDQLATIASDGTNFRLWGFGGHMAEWRPSLPVQP